MVFMCQRNSYLQTCITTVIASEPGKCKVVNDKGSLSSIQGFFIELKDTVLFPEGGGQPDDRGTINNIPVKKVFRKGAKAFHFVEEDIPVGAAVEVVVDWERRFDHMQQHSAQHLITAIADNEFGFQTTSWDLGKSVSSIEMDTSVISAAQLERIENMVNEAIRQQHPVEVHITQVGSPLLDGVRARGLPDDHVGDVRIVEMKSVDANMCCGTHVSNLAHLQVVKLLSVEKAKKGKTYVFYIAGNRVLNYTEKSYNKEKEMTRLLKCASDQHVSMMEKSLNQLKVTQKHNTTLLRRLAVLEGQSIKSEANGKRLVSFHQKEGNIEFMNAIANEVGSQTFMFLTVGDEKGKGMFLLSGPLEFVSTCGPLVADAIEGKGLAKGNRMQGKADKLQRRQQAIELCEDYMNKCEDIERDEPTS